MTGHEFDPTEVGRSKSARAASLDDLVAGSPFLVGFGGQGSRWPGTLPGGAWKAYAPTLARLPHGRVVVETAFTRLTGRSPILLAGMTPTTVDTEMVAAAANGGYWAELSGADQVTEAVLAQSISELGEKLDPGRAVQFNSMFLDPYLWTMQVGGKKMVPRARTAGAAIDGIVVTAGIPEFDEALDLITELRSAGIEYVCFKPGTVAQIGAVVKIAKAAVGEQIIVQVEGGRAGGQHSGDDLDDLLIATYQQLRSVPNLVLCVGGDIGTPERAADYLTGHWSVQLGYPAMPVDGILVDTAAMAVLEAATTELLGRFEDATVDRLLKIGRTAVAVAGRRRDDRLDGPMSIVLAAENVVWAGRHVINPVLLLEVPSSWELTDDGAMELDGIATLTELDPWTVELSVRIAGDTFVSIVITAPVATEDGGVPVIEAPDAMSAMHDFLTIAAGSELPEVTDGVSYSTVAWMPGMSFGHSAVTAAGLPDHLHVGNEPVPDVLMGACWPTVYAVLGAATTTAGIHVVEGVLDLVHLEHVVDVYAPLPKSSSALVVRAAVKSVSDTESGRFVEISVAVQGTGAEDLGVGDIAEMTERFVIRGRIGDAPVPVGPVLRGQSTSRPTRRKRWAEVTVAAPDSMAAFAAVSSDHNPIHTCATAAALAGLDGPIVSGMWLSAAAQHVVTSSAGTGSFAGWSAQFLAPVLPGDRIDVTVDRIATASGSDVVEVACTVDGCPVMSATAVLWPGPARPPRSLDVPPSVGFGHVSGFVVDGQY